jgi:vancomycin resistance protein YoaR
VAGRGLGGIDPDSLQSTVAEVAAAYRGAHVHIASPAGELDQTASAVGLTLDEPATVTAILAVDRGTSIFTRPFRWLRSLFVSRAAPLVFHVDHAQLTQGVSELWQANHIEPVEPGITNSGTTMAATPSAPGADIDLDALASSLMAAADTGTTPISVSVAPVATNPRFTDQDAVALAAQATKITQAPLVVQVNGKAVTMQPTTTRSWLGSVAGVASLDIQVDQAKLVADIAKVGGQVGTEPTPVSFAVAGDQVQINDGQNGSVCCAPDSGARVVAALQAGQTSVALDVIPQPPAHDRAWADSLGIHEVIGSFTTHHPCCAPRVVNIHQMADAVRGMLIEPGQTFSLNDRVGQRTAEKGYVEAPVIYDSVMSSDIGGGVSQFATTLFNAAFFGGLDYGEYQSHSEFIDRYPYGREATVSWTSPDLQIKNTTPYGVLIWTSYDGTSITVTLYSTRFAAGDQTGQSREPKGPCTRVTTDRTRTYVDGHTAVDHVYALYQPAEGVKCP